MAGIRDVAREASVSVSTVSHVINGTRHVEPETAERVRRAITQLGYQPNSVARSLRHGRTHTIGLLVPDNANPFFAEVARVVEDEGFKAGYSVILCNSDGSEVKEKAYIDVLLAKQVDGLLLIASSNELAGLDRILNAAVPVVAVDREIHHAPITQILIDNWQGGYIAGAHLIDLGHREFVYITGPNETTPSAQRLQGFRQALAEAGLALSENRIVSGDFRFAGGQHAMEEVLRGGLPFTAVFAANDLMAMGAISTLHAARIHVPNEVSLIGFDDIPYAVTTLPPMTTVAQPVEAIGQTCVRTLIDHMRHPDRAPERIVLSPHLVVRESCAPRS
jgi:LacI family transcriptional regulator